MSDKSEKIIVALDTPDLLICKKLVNALKQYSAVFKIGSELFTACGHEAIKLVREAGCKVFLDLKFHDIPNTVANVAMVVARMGVYMFNVHACGGMKMMKMMREALAGETKKRGLPMPKTLAVTVLTSMGDEELKDELGVGRTLEEQVMHFATMAKEAGLDGVVASAKEVEMIKARFSSDFMVVTPGIRPKWSVAGDQTRIVTPKEAIEKGVDYMVIGRPITASPDPAEAFRKILEEI